MVRRRTVPASVSVRMRAIRQRGTSPELEVRRILSGLGLRYRACVRSLPGSPDLANKRGAWAVFVHGCFWHGHRGCKLATIPKTNRVFWKTKFEANRMRDRKKRILLRQEGFRVVTIWQCELARPAMIERKLVRGICGK